MQFDKNEEYHYFLGLLCSDGHLDRSEYRLCFTNNDKGMVEFFKNYLENFNFVSNCNTIMKSNSDNCYRYRIQSKELYDHCKSIGIEENKANTISKIEIEQNYYSEFLCGIVDGDGTIHRNKKQVTMRIYTSSKGFADFLLDISRQLMVSNKNKSLNFNEPCYVINFGKYDTISIYNSISFSNIYKSRKWKKLEKPKLNIHLQGKSGYSMDKLVELKKEYNRRSS